MAKLSSNKPNKSAPTLGKARDERPERFNPEADAFAGGGRPPDDGKHLFFMRLSEKPEQQEIKVMEYDEKDKDGRLTGRKAYDFSLRFEAEIVDKDDPDNGKRVYGSLDTFTRKRGGGTTFGVATVLGKLGVVPTGKKKTDTETLKGLLAKGQKIWAKSRWIAELVYDKDSDADYKKRQKQPFLKGQLNFVPEGKEREFANAVPLSQVPEDTEIEAKVKGKSEVLVYREGEPLRTYAELTQYFSMEEGGRE